MGLFVDVPDQFPPKGAWTYDAFPLTAVVCCKRNGVEAILADLEGFPAATEVLVLDVPLSLLFLGRSAGQVFLTQKMSATAPGSVCWSRLSSFTF